MGRVAGARAWFAAAMMGVAAGLLLRTPAVGRAEDAAATPTFRSSRAGTHDPLGAKLEQIEDNDQRILARFDDVMEEMKIVKIRVLRQPQVPP